MGKQRKVADLKTFEKYIKDFINRCENEDLKPSDYNLRKFLGVSQSTLDRYYKGDKATGVAKVKDKRTGEMVCAYHGYDEVLKDLISYREHYYSTMLDQRGANVAGAIIQLKQPKNGGYTDAPIVAQGSATLTLKVEGVGGMDAFK